MHQENLTLGCTVFLILEIVKFFSEMFFRQTTRFVNTLTNIRVAHCWIKYSFNLHKVFGYAN